MSRSTNRRKIIQALGTVSAIGLAGCSGSGNGDSDDSAGDGSEDGGENVAGERVPPVTFEYWSDFGGTTQIHESAIPMIQEAFEALGVELEVAPVGFTTQVEQQFNDERTHQASLAFHYSDPDRLDPQEQTRRMAADWAGEGGQSNLPNYANCEYTHYAIQQASAPDEETRRELVYSAQEIFSEDMVAVPIVPDVIAGIARTDQIELNGVGERGIEFNNPYPYIKSEPIDGDTIIADITPTYAETVNYLILDISPVWWNYIPNSPLIGYDENNNLTEILAESYEASNQARQLVVEIRDDATFHNGDPVTAEDARWTYNYIADNAVNFPQAGTPPYESIEVIDDKTVQFNFEDPHLPLLSQVLPRWGVMHKETWVNAGAEENPESARPDPFVGSGPFKIVDFSPGDSITFDPHDGHPIHSPNHRLIFDVFDDEVATAEAIRSGSINIAAELTLPSAIDISEDLSDVVTLESVEGHMPHLVYLQYPAAPMKFRELRHAIAMAIDREEINEIAFFGESEPELYSTIFMEAHPFRPPEDRLTQMAPDATGDVEGARQILEDAGWSWDDEGNLRYPDDVDLEPRWPQGESPSSEYGFECLDEEGNYVQTEDKF